MAVIFPAFFDSSRGDRGHINTLATFVLFSLKRIRERFLFNNKYLKYHSTRNCCMWEALMIAIAAELNKLELILAVQFGFLAFRAKFE